MTSPTSATEGAGVVSSWADLGSALGAEHVDAGQVAVAVADAGLDTLGVALHPFDGLAQAGFGWLIEHVEFLREPLDALAGDPAEVIAQARGWHRVAVELRSAAAEHRAAPVAGWAGIAADGYRGSAEALAAAMEAEAEQAAELSQLVLATGAGVATVRALIRDAIADFLATVLQYLLAAGTLAFLTAGGSLATVVLTIVSRALQLAETICRRLRQALDALAAAGGAAGRIGAAMQQAVDGARAAAPGARAVAEVVDRSAADVGAPIVVEAGTQFTGAAQQRREWPGYAE